MSFLKILTENFCHICSRAFVCFPQAASVSLIRSVTIFCERFSKRGQTSFWTSVRLSSYQLTFEFRTGVFLKMRRGWLAASTWSQKKAFFRSRQMYQEAVSGRRLKQCMWTATVVTWERGAHELTLWSGKVYFMFYFFLWIPWFQAENRWALLRGKSPSCPKWW